MYELDILPDADSRLKRKRTREGYYVVPYTKILKNSVYDVEERRQGLRSERCKGIRAALCGIPAEVVHVLLTFVDLDT